MPEYLKIDQRLAELPFDEAERLLAEQQERVQAVIARLSETDRLSTSVFENVVSV